VNVDYWLPDSEERDYKLSDIPSPTDMAKAIERVRELHKQNEYNECKRCSKHTCWGCQEWSECFNCECPCHGTYPCDTIKILDGDV